jgi:hypothetical protein
MPSEVPTRGWDAEIIIDEGEGQYIISELSPKYNDSPACPLSPRSELKGKTNMAVIPAMVPLQTFQMSSPAYSFDRALPRAAAVVLECEVGPGERSTLRDAIEGRTPGVSEAGRRAIEGGAEGQGPSDGRMDAGIMERVSV